MRGFSGRFSSKSKLLRTTFVSGIFGLVDRSRRCWWGLALDLLPRYRPEAGPCLRLGSHLPAAVWSRLCPRTALGPPSVSPRLRRRGLAVRQEGCGLGGSRRPAPTCLRQSRSRTRQGPPGGLVLRPRASASTKWKIAASCSYLPALASIEDGSRRGRRSTVRAIVRVRLHLLMKVGRSAPEIRGHEADEDRG